MNANLALWHFTEVLGHIPAQCGLILHINNELRLQAEKVLQLLVLAVPISRPFAAAYEANRPRARGCLSLNIAQTGISIIVLTSRNLPLHFKISVSKSPGTFTVGLWTLILRNSKELSTQIILKCQVGKRSYHLLVGTPPYSRYLLQSIISRYVGHIGILLIGN